MTVAKRYFTSYIDPRTGAIARWVAGFSSTHRVVFVASLNDVTLLPQGRPTAYRLYALCRYTPLSPTPLDDYEVKSRITRASVAKLPSQARAKRRLATVEPVQMALLLENIEVQKAIGRLFHTVDHGALTAISTMGWGSVFEAAFLCNSAFVEPGSSTGAVELETTIYYAGLTDLKLHSILRVEARSN